jgi:hypothetical protein
MTPARFGPTVDAGCVVVGVLTVLGVDVVVSGLFELAEP